MRSESLSMAVEKNGYPYLDPLETNKKFNMLDCTSTLPFVLWKISDGAWTPRVSSLSNNDPLATFIGLGIIPLETACILLHRQRGHIPSATTFLQWFEYLNSRPWKDISLMDPLLYPQMPGVSRSHQESFRKKVWDLLCLVGNMIVPPGDPMAVCLRGVEPTYSNNTMRILVSSRIGSAHVKAIELPPEIGAEDTFVVWFRTIKVTRSPY